MVLSSLSLVSSAWDPRPWDLNLRNSIPFFWELLDPSFFPTDLSPLILAQAFSFFLAVCSNEYTGSSHSTTSGAYPASWGPHLRVGFAFCRLFLVPLHSGTKNEVQSCSSHTPAPPRLPHFLSQEVLFTPTLHCPG